MKFLSKHLPVIVGIGILLSAFYGVGAFTAPTQGPPNGNVAAPLNTSESWQLKTGRLLTHKDFNGQLQLSQSGGSVSVGMSYQESCCGNPSTEGLTENHGYSLNTASLPFALPGGSCSVTYGGETTQYANSGVYTIADENLSTENLLSYECTEYEPAIAEVVILRNQGRVYGGSGGRYDGIQIGETYNTIRSNLGSSFPGDLSTVFTVPGNQGPVLITACTVSGQAYISYFISGQQENSTHVATLRSIQVDGVVVFPASGNPAPFGTVVNYTALQSHNKGQCATVQINNLSSGSHTLVIDTVWLTSSSFWSPSTTTYKVNATQDAVLRDGLPFSPGIWYAATAYKRTK